MCIIGSIIKSAIPELQSQPCALNNLAFIGTSVSVFTESVRGEGHGYVISLSFWEQLTMSVMNLLDLQCWAATRNLMVVEPLLAGPYAKFTFNETLAQTWLTMSDVYNVSDWNRHSAQSGLSPLVDRKEFFDVALNLQMKVVLVQFQFDQKKCNFYWPKFAGKRFLLALKQWEVVRTVCTSYSQPSFETFNELMFGSKYPPQNTVVIFSLWPGFEPISIPHALSMCKEGRKYVCQKPPSERLLRDAKLYADRYLGGFGQYLAIVARFEKPVAVYWELDPQQYREAIANRIAEATGSWEDLKKNTSLSSTFLSFDYGSFGSDTFRKKNYYGSQQTLEHFHQTVYDNQLSLTEWEESFEKITHINHTAYVTLLQLQIAAHAKCIVIVGVWSSYQKVIHQTYLRYHPNNACVHIIGAVGNKHC